MRRALILAAVLVAAVAGVAAASAVTGEPSPRVASERDHRAQPGSVRVGQGIADPDGGPAWAVRRYVGESGLRCIVVGRTDGARFGPVDPTGRVADTAVDGSGSCADPAAAPAQVAVALYPTSGAGGPRSVLFGVADESVRSLQATGPDGEQIAIELDAQRSFAVVRRGLTIEGGWTVSAQLDDGTRRTYRL